MLQASGRAPNDITHQLRAKCPRLSNSMVRYPPPTLRRKRSLCSLRPSAAGASSLTRDGLSGYARKLLLGGCRTRAGLRHRGARLRQRGPMSAGPRCFVRAPGAIGGRAVGPSPNRYRPPTPTCAILRHPPYFPPHYRLPSNSGRAVAPRGQTRASGTLP